MGYGVPVLTARKTPPCTRPVACDNELCSSTGPRNGTIVLLQRPHKGLAKPLQDFDRAFAPSIVLRYPPRTAARKSSFLRV
jgi:hypothetical protein